MPGGQSEARGRDGAQGEPPETPATLQLSCWKTLSHTAGLGSGCAPSAGALPCQAHRLVSCRSCRPPKPPLAVPPTCAYRKLPTPAGRKQRAKEGGKAGNQAGSSGAERGRKRPTVREILRSFLLEGRSRSGGGTYQALPTRLRNVGSTSANLSHCGI